MDKLWWVVMGIVPIGLVIISIIQFILQIRKRGKEETVQDRIQKLTTSLREAAELISNVESEIKGRSALADKLQSDVETYNKIVQLKKPEVEAVAQLLREELKREGKRSFWKGFAMNFVYFLLGAITAVIITLATK